jgi:serine/threonine protein kinase
MNKYEIIKDIGGGSFGVVYEGINKQTNEKVAIKKLKQKIDSWEACMNQNEVYFLRKLVHPNIIKLIEVIREPNSDISFVFEYCDCNLYEYISNHRKRKKAISEDKIHNIIYNITKGLSYMHSQNIMHRDLKPENILISLNNLNNANFTNSNSIKIADFGTAKQVPQYKNEELTDYICTRWYRAPECVLRSKNYNEKVDIWALGCIMAELYTLKPLFPGQSVFDQMDKIVRLLGTPNYEDWPEGYRLMESLNLKFTDHKRQNFRNIFFDISDEAIDFLEYIFQYDSAKRPSANQLLNHPYLKTNLLSRNDINTYRSKSRKENIQLYRNNILRNSSIPIPYNYKINTEEKNDYNNRNNNISSPTFLVSQIKNNNINIQNTRFNDENMFYNKKPCGRSKSSVIDQINNYNNINDNNNIHINNNNNTFRDNNIIKNNNYDYSNFLNFENDNKEMSVINKLLNKNIMNIHNKYNTNIYNTKKNYSPFNGDYNSPPNNALSSVAKNEIVNKPLIFNKYIDKQKETLINDKFHNVMPKIRKYTNNSNNYYMYNDNKNVGFNNFPEGKYKSFFGTRYNL